MDWKRLVDLALEAPVVTSFTRIGHDVRSRVDEWTSLDDYDLSGRRVLLTGGTSGLGRAAARQLASCGADVIITGRSADRTNAAAGQIDDDAGRAVEAVAADMGELAQVRALAEQVQSSGPIDVLIHNAGALSADRRETSAGHEATVASQVYGPFLLTHLLLDDLRAGDRPGRVLTMSSGGMYAANLSVTGLEMSPDDYNGTRQYALAKRAQVTLNETWAERHPDVRFHAVHPGWADTPGVDDALPVFGAVVGPLLRTPEQGADTLVWLAADDAAEAASGEFWLDRRTRSLHRTPFSRAADTPERRARLWNLVAERSGTE